MADLSGRTLGEFILREQIGEGGYSVVYRAEQPRLKRDVVVKVLREQRRDETSRMRFLREARLAALLDHPYAAHVYASGTEPEDGILWIAMELVQGVPLDVWLDQHGPMPPDQFVSLFECAAEVTDAAHERGIVHRDLKPSNLIVVELGGRRFLKLLDLGIAKMLLEAAPPAPESEPDDSLAESGAPTAPDPDDVVTVQLLRRPRRERPTVTHSHSESKRRLTPSGAGLGSRAYMAPEQWYRAERVSPAADIYSLGVVAFQALTGRLPFPADRSDELQQRGDVRPPRLLWPEIDDVLQAALAKSPGDRPGSALELASALRRALPASRREQLRAAAQQWKERNRPPGLLWGADVLAEVTRQFPPETLGELERSFVAEGQRRARRTRWARRLLVALAAMIALATVGIHHQMMRADAAEKLVRQAGVEEGRQALLHDDLAEARLHLTKAYRGGDRSPATAFMLARALQPLRAEKARFAAKAGHMWSVAFSPDGRQIVTADDGAAQVWDAQTHERRFTLQHGDVYDARYSADHTRLVTACGDSTVRIWDAITGAPVRTLKRQRTDGKPSLYFIAIFSPDNRLVAAVDTTGAVTHVWDAGSGALLAELRNAAASFPAIAFSADARWLATSGGEDAHVFDTRTWTPVLTIAGPHIRALSFDPAASRLATGSASGDATIWEIPSGARAQHLREIGAIVRAVAFSPDGKLVATGDGDGVVQFWDARSGALRNQVNALHGRILSIEFDPSSKLAVAAGDGGTVVVAEAIGVPVVVLDAPQTVVKAAHFDPTSRQVVSADWGGTARMWDATLPYRRWGSPPVTDRCDLVTSLEPDRRFIAVGCKDHPTRIWDTAHDRLIAELPSVTPVAGDFASAFPAVSIAGDRAAIARGNTVEVYELPNARLARVIKHPAAVDTVAFSHVGHDLVSGATDGSLLVTRDDQEPIELPTSPGGVDTAGFLPSGRIMATDVRRRLRIYDADRGAVVADLDLPTRVRLLRPSPDGARLVTIPSFTGKTAPPLLWDLERYQRIAELNDHVGQAFSARFANGSREILTTGDDGMARLWNGKTGQLLSSYRSTSRFLTDAAATTDGSMIVAGGSDGALWFWDRATTRPLWRLQAHSSHVAGIHFEGDALVTRGFGGEVARWTFPNPERVIEAVLSDR